MRAGPTEGGTDARSVPRGLRGEQRGDVHPAHRRDVTSTLLLGVRTLDG